MGTVILAWSPPPYGEIKGYRVYCGTTSRGYLQTFGSGTFSSTISYSMSGLPSGQTYYFAVTAIDAQGGESDYSIEATKLIP
jgi:fibronectin type 3 domain-containing protein